MRRTAALALATLAVLATLPEPATANGDGGDYPRALTTFVEGILANAEATVWPAGATIEANATRQLELAEKELAEGNLQRAIDGYLLFRVEVAYQALYADAQGRSQSDARGFLHNATGTLATEGEALAKAGRDIINELDVDALSIRGGETAVWGALLHARGESQLNLMDEVRALRLTDGERIEPTVLRQLVFAPVAGRTLVELGTSIASLAPQVRGEELPPGELDARIDEAARRRIQGTPTPELLDNLPRGNATTDSSLLRLGLTLHAAEEIRSIEIRRIYLNAAQRGDISPQVKEGLDFDVANLEPWTDAGSPLALAAAEGVSLELEEIDVRNQMGLITRARALAQTVFSVEQTIDPREAKESPGVGAVGLVALVVGLAAAHRRRSS